MRSGSNRIIGGKPLVIGFGPIKIEFRPQKWYWHLDSPWLGQAKSVEVERRETINFAEQSHVGVFDFVINRVLSVFSV